MKSWLFGSQREPSSLHSHSLLVTRIQNPDGLLIKTRLQPSRYLLRSGHLFSPIVIKWVMLIAGFQTPRSSRPQQPKRGGILHGITACMDTGPTGPASCYNKERITLQVVEVINGKPTDKGSSSTSYEPISLVQFLPRCDAIGGPRKIYLSIPSHASL